MPYLSASVDKYGIKPLRYAPISKIDNQSG
jgi:hypothetical protein